MKGLFKRFKTNNRLGWDNVPLGAYIKAEKVVNEDVGDKDKALERTLKLLSILKGKDYGNVPVAEYMEAVGELDFLNTEIPQIKLPKEFDINGRKYKLTGGIGDISTAQFIDFTNYIKSEEENKLIYMLSCFVMPADAKGYFQGYTLEDIFGDLESMPMIYAHNIVFFFSGQSRKLWETTRNYFAYQTLTMKKVPLKKKLKILEKLAAVWKSMV